MPFVVCLFKMKCVFLKCSGVLKLTAWSKATLLMTMKLVSLYLYGV